MINEITKTSKKVSVIEKLINEKSIILHNDDINTFDHVIEMLVKYCSHNEIQAEQCAFIVHYSGKCEIKKGTYSQLKPICEALVEQGLNAEIN